MKRKETILIVCITDFFHVLVDQCLFRKLCKVAGHHYRVPNLAAVDLLFRWFMNIEFKILDIKSFFLAV